MAIDKELNPKELERILYDNRTFLEKNIRDWRKADYATAAQQLNGFAGTTGKIRTVVQNIPAGPLAPAVQKITSVAGKIPSIGAGTIALSGIVGNTLAKEELERIAHYFGEGELRQLENNPIYRDEINRTKGRWYEDMKEATVSLLGSLGGGALAGIFTLNPIIALAGAIGGGYAANGLYNAAFSENLQNPVAIAMQAARMQSLKEEVPAEVVFAALAANLKGPQGERAANLLEKLTGTKSFLEALGDPKNLEKLRAMMHDPETNNIIAAQTGMIPDPMNINKPVAEQYAELINSGKLQASKMLEPGAGMYATIEAANNMQVGNIDTQLPSVPFPKRQQQVVIPG